MKRTATLLLSCAACSAPEFDPQMQELSAEEPAPQTELRAPAQTVEPVDDETAAFRELEALQRTGAQRALAALDAETRKELDRRGMDPSVPTWRFNSAGTPSKVGGPGFAATPEDLGLEPGVSSHELADAFVRRYAAVWHVDPGVFDDARVQTSRGSNRPETRVEYVQRYEGLPVVGARLVVHVEEDGPTVTGAIGSMLAVDQLSTHPSIEADEARAAVQTELDEHAERPSLVVWSGFRMGGDPTPRLAWAVPVALHDVVRRHVYIDAHEGDELHLEQVEMDALQRSLFDHRGDPGYGMYVCENWTAAASCGSHCADCVSDPRACALCTCPFPSDPADCEDVIWRYADPDECTADGAPTGEPNCDPEALELWDDAKLAYGFWDYRFGRDSWDDAGTWIHMVPNIHPATAWFAGVAFPRDVDGDDVYDTATVGILDGAANPFLHGHEFGHILQFGTRTDDGSSFHRQGIDAMEHNADVHGHRYQGLSLGAGYDCSGWDLRNYGQFRSHDAGQSNKFIGNCHGWLMHQGGGSTTHYGVPVSPQPPAVYDQIWFTALDDYFATSHDYFDWWNDMIEAAYDVYGFSAPLFTATDARDAIGGWTDFSSVASGVRKEERYPAVSWNGGTNTPCVFHRDTGSQTILFNCRSGSGWTTYAPLNDPSIDPAASEPAATFRYSSGTTEIHVAWAGTDNRIHYRTLDPASMTIGPPQDFGPSHLTASVPAIAPIYESGSLDRLVVVYHPLAQPSWFFWTYLGSPDPAIDMGPSFDSDADPALTAFPYWDRIYFVRPDASWSATPGRLRYTSYTMAGGWESATDLTALYESDPLIQPGAVTTDNAVTLAPYGRGSTRLRMTWVTTGADPELWFATLSEASPGVLARDDYRAVPMASTYGASQSAGGMAADPSGFPLYHFWGQGSTSAPKLYEWRMYGD